MYNLKYFIFSFVLPLALAADYYIEPSPTAPRLCTLARPCSIGLLPSLTLGDTVHFLPATTGTSNTYSFGNRVIESASVVIDSPLITFSNCILRNTFSDSFILNSAKFVAGGSLSTQSVASVTISNGNFTGGATVVLDGQTVTVTDSVFSGLSGSSRHIFYGATVSVINLVFSDSKSSGNLVSFQPSGSYSSALTLSLDTLAFSNCNTTSTASSIVAIQTNAGKSVNAGTITGVSFNNCNSKAAILLVRCIYQPSIPEFSIISTISDMTVTGGSVLKGLIALESTAAQATITHTTDTLVATRVNFGANAVYTLSTAGSEIKQNNVLGGTITICESTNLNYIASCGSTGGAPVYNDYALIRGTYANVAIGPFNACTNTSLEIVDTCGMD